MPNTYYLHPSLVYYLDPASPDGLRVVEEPGRCNLYWHFVSSGDLAMAQLHLERCEDCRDWLDRCEEIVMRTNFQGGPLENISGMTVPARR